MIKNTPLQNCPQCKGTGKFVNKLRREINCICTGISGQNDELRRLAVTSFRKTIKLMSEELKACKGVEL